MPASPSNVNLRFGILALQVNFITRDALIKGLRAREPDDGPALVLLSRVVNSMVEETASFDPVWVLGSK